MSYVVTETSPPYRPPTSLFYQEDDVLSVFFFSSVHQLLCGQTGSSSSSFSRFFLTNLTLVSGEKLCQTFGCLLGLVLGGQYSSGPDWISSTAGVPEVLVWLGLFVFNQSVLLVWSHIFFGSWLIQSSWTISVHHWQRSRTSLVCCCGSGLKTSLNNRNIFFVLWHYFTLN